MKAVALDHLNMSVRDLAESLDWYGRVFGFEKVEDGVYDGAPWAIVRSEGALLCLYEHPERASPDGGDGLAEKGLLGVAHFGLRIDDRAAWEDTLHRENVEVQYGGPVRWPHSTSWYVSDPSGYEIEVALWKDGIAF